jgi:hypothetical protein
MRKLIAITFIAALGFAASAQAMLLAPAPADGLTIHVAQGCGPGLRRNVAGECRPGFMVRRPCPPGMHKNRIGVCRPN